MLMKIEDTLECIIDNRGKTPPTVEEGRNLLEINCISNNGKFPDYSVVKKHVSEETYASWFRAGHPKRGDVLIPTVGTLDAIGFINRDDCCIAQNLIAFRTKKDVCNSEYLFYLLCDPTIRRRLLNLDIGGVQPSIKVPHLKKLEVEIPSIDIQTKVVSVLRSIDEKITCNEQINRNLSEQALALFDRMYLAHDAEDICCLSDLAEINPKRILRKNANARCIDMAKLSSSGAFPEGWDYKPYTGGMKFVNGDTLLARITPCLENGKAAYVNFLEEQETAFGSTEYIVLASKGATPSELLYCLARYPKFVDYAFKNMNGSSGRQRVSGETIGKYQIPRFTDQELRVFGDTIREFFETMKQNSMENMSLVEIRDSLLPRLMSGDLDVTNLNI